MSGTGHNNQKIKELGERVTALEASWKTRYQQKNKSCFQPY